MGRPESGRDGLPEAALTEFSERGFRKTTLEDIARRADVSKGTLYNYFRDKKDLYHQACDHAFRPWDEWVCVRAEEADDPAEKLRRLARELYYYLADHPETRRLLQKDPDLFPIFGEPVYRDGKELDTVKYLRSLLSEGMRRNVFRKMDVDRVIRALVTVFRTFVVESYLEPGATAADETAEETLRIVVDGLLSR